MQPPPDDNDDLRSAGGGGDPASDPELGKVLTRLPMFPLPGVVLFPHALLPLHIFEERYKKMTRDLLSGQRHLAVALLADGAVASERAAPVHPIMGVGEVVMVRELPEGRFNLVVRGRVRVRLVEEIASDEPYRLIRAALLPEVSSVSPADLRDADQALRALVGRMADALPDGGELLRQVVASHATPEELADVLTAALIPDVRRRQALLETGDLGRRLESVTAEVVAMTERIGADPKVN